ncbi:fragment of DNA polymerase III subunit gamma/tau (part 2) [Tenacibaculum maritimum]|nr:fragment of DNA polymerase III subunit gamma/tau (part 2) [Tenacibaculum maritimum]
MEQKKKSSNYIIPATFFTALSPALTKKKITTSEPEVTVKPSTIEKIEEVVKSTTKPKKTRLEGVRRRSSSLSLKSVHEKKDDKKTIDLEENFDNYPKDLFTQEQLEETWKKYYFKLIDKGEKSIASIISAGKPQLQKGFNVNYSLPNKLMSDQLERGKPKLLRFLRERLNNYGIHIQITISEVVEKKFAYTPQEKYEKLKEKNPFIDLLRKTFHLEL